ncbi:hypothetical protein RvY_17644-2 [Ramazzottius varieornatus]|uniref:DMAP1-binding domain-containing protein n=1 Tax=Ramazzottius varieornatus TaxID=947166 RepID=A0A1D1W9R2_RAMVA|nr:hypothetical protein RvY_17644-2 [Ramazzottius varieornatus]
MDIWEKRNQSSYQMEPAKMDTSSTVESNHTSSIIVLEHSNDATHLANGKDTLSHLNVGTLPAAVRERLAELDVELSEGLSVTNGTGSNCASPGIRARRKAARKLTRDGENRFHSEIRQEQVQKALAEMKEKSAVPLNSKRHSILFPTANGLPVTVNGNGDASLVRKISDSGSSEEDEDSMKSGHDSSSNVSSMRTSSLKSQDGQSSFHSDTSNSTGVAIYQNQISYSSIERTSASTALSTTVVDGLTELINNLAPSMPVDVTKDVPPHTSTVAHGTYSHNHMGSLRMEREDSSERRPGKVSAKIQQLLTTLKKPKRKSLAEYFEDDDRELEIAANTVNPNAPKPEGAVVMPFVGERLPASAGVTISLEAALHQHGKTFPKTPALSVLDSNGRMSSHLAYAKLLSRSQRICFNLLNKTSQREGTLKIKPGDRVALIYPNADPLSFVCAFYGCLMAGVVPVMVEAPLTKRDAGCQQVGFFLGSCGVQLALTSDTCFKALPRNANGELTSFKGWPKLQWMITDSLGKAPRDWEAPGRLMDDLPAYIEYTSDRDGHVMGVTVPRNAMIKHCRSLTAVCGYDEGEVMVSVVDFKRDVGLWHSVLTSIYNRMHVIFIPYALMKISPGSWLLTITKFRASVAVVKSRDLHWGVLAQRDHRDVNLSTLRILLVADGSNPWSLTSCDQFVNVFQSKGLRPDVVCPCASSAEALTVAIRRPGSLALQQPGAPSGRGVLSMSALSYGVIRVDHENSLTSLTLQDSGKVLPDGSLLVLKIDGPPYLCKTDEIGEICVDSPYVGSGYWGLQGISAATFKVHPLRQDDSLYRDRQYVRTGLLGFLGPGGLLFVCGSRQGLMQVSGRKHNTDDIIATILAVEPMKFIYRGRIAVFSVKVLRDERICVVAEQRPDCTEDESFQWMSRVLQAVDSIHQVGIYCLALVLPNQLPKTSLGGIHLSETRKRFLDGALHPSNVLMCPHTCVTNLPKPRETQADLIGPASMMVGSIVQGVRLAEARGRDLHLADDDTENAKKYQFITEILRWRATTSPEHVIYTLLSAKGLAVGGLTCGQLHKRAEKMAAFIQEKADVQPGDNVALVFPPGTDLICAFYACLYIGVVPVTIRPPQIQNLSTTLPTVKMITDVSKSRAVLSTSILIRLMKSKEASVSVDPKSWPPLLDADDQPRKKTIPSYRPPSADAVAYIDFSVSTTGILAGVKMSHAALTALCRSQKLACELYPSRHVTVCLDPYCGLGFVLWVLNSVYSGHHSILIPPSEVEQNPALWITTVSQYRARDTFCSYGVMDITLRGLGGAVAVLKERGLSLSCVRTCVVVAEERPRISLTTSFSKLFSTLGLSAHAVSTAFGCRVNVALCVQGASSPDPTTLYVDMRALRNDRVTLVERGSPHSLCLMESGKLLPGVKVVIANPETKGQCGDSHLGEIWVSSPHNSTGYFSTFGESALTNDHFHARLTTGDTRTVYARTGYLGFLRRTEAIGPEGELHDAVFVVGALDETLLLRGMRFHPIDIETSVLKSDKRICESAVFSWTNLLVVTVELDGSEGEALDLVPIVTNVVLEDHHLVVGIVVVVDPGTVPINSRGEKQRMHLRDSFLADQLDPLYCAYNM